jgi:hypothetical protein
MWKEDERKFVSVDEGTPRRLLRILGADDVGQPFPVGGRVLAADVGKAVYDVDGVVQVENAEQRDSRVLTNAQLHMLMVLNEATEQTRRHNDDKRTLLARLEAANEDRDPV